VFSDTSSHRRGIFYLKTDIPVDDAVLRALRDSNPKEAQARCGLLAKAVQATLGELVHDIRPGQSQGTFHLIHHVSMQSGAQMIARSTAPGIFERDEGMALEAYAQTQCRELGLPSLRVHAVDTSRRHAPFEFMLTDMAPGRSLAALPDADMDDPVRLFALGTAMRQWHHIPASGAGLLDLSTLETGLRGVHDNWHDYLALNLDTHIHTCLSLGLCDDDAATAMRDWFAALQSAWDARPACLLHGDPGNHNIFMDGVQVSAVVDWEDAMAGDPLYDVAFWATFHPARRWAAFLEGYGIADESDRDFTVPFTLYFLRVILAKLVHRHRFGYKDVPGRPTAKERLAQAVQLVKEAL